MRDVQAAGWLDRVREYVDELAEYWIGFAFPPVRSAMADADWLPDARERYCGRCGDSVGVGEVTEGGCSTCRRGGELAGGIGDGVVRLGPHVGALRRWILALKYRRWAEMGGELGRVLGRQIEAADLVDMERAVVVPMPMPWQRRLYRGIDHARVIAAGVAEELRLPLAAVLGRRQGPPQVSLPRSVRRRSGSHGLYVRWRLGGWPLGDLHLVLVDDVRTTGASLRAATRLLRTLQPGRIVCAVAAVSDSAARKQREMQLGRVVAE